jgi:hypothetical protein
MAALEYANTTTFKTHCANSLLRDWAQSSEPLPIYSSQQRVTRIQKWVGKTAIASAATLVSLKRLLVLSRTSTDYDEKTTNPWTTGAIDVAMMTAALTKLR